MDIKEALNSLNREEREILHRICAGEKRSQIGNRLDPKVHESTIYNRQREIYAKLQARGINPRRQEEYCHILDELVGNPPNYNFVYIASTEEPEIVIEEPLPVPEPTPQPQPQPSARPLVVSSNTPVRPPESNRRSCLSTGIILVLLLIISVGAWQFVVSPWLFGDTTIVVTSTSPATTAVSVAEASPTSVSPTPESPTPESPATQAQNARIALEETQTAEFLLTPPTITNTPEPTMTTAPTMTPTPTQTVVPPNILDDFGDNQWDAEWEIIEGEPIIINGGLAGKNVAVTMIIGDNRWTDYAVEIQTQRIIGWRDSNLVIVRYTGREGLAFSYTSDAYGVRSDAYELSDGKWSEIGNYNGELENGIGVFRIEVRGNAVFVLVNGQQVFSMTTTIPAGRVGLKANENTQLTYFKVSPLP